MKPILTIGVILCATIGHAQVYKFKAFQTYYRPSSQTRPIEDYEWKKQDILIVINFDKGKIKTFGDTEGDYDLIQTYETTQNSNGDKVVSWSGVDKDGDKCTIELTIFNDKSGIHIATLNMRYPDGSLLWRLKKDE